MMTGLTVLEPGLWTTIQDRGRAYRANGVPPSGPFDERSACLANMLAGNPRHAAVIELTLHGGRYRANAHLGLSLAGADFAGSIQASADDRELQRVTPGQTFQLKAGQILSFGHALEGARAYLAVRGGWQTDRWLGSRCRELPLRQGELLPAVASDLPERFIKTNLIDSQADPLVLRVLDGPSSGRDPSETWKRFQDFDLVICSRSNRIGVRCVRNDWQGRANQKMKTCSHRINRSGPVTPGAVQAAPSGLILLGPYAGTMGGYPHLGTIIRADLSKLAQARPGQHLRLQWVSWEEALHLDRTYRCQLRWIELRSASLNEP